MNILAVELVGERSFIYSESCHTLFPSIPAKVAYCQQILEKMNKTILDILSLESQNKSFRLNHQLFFLFSETGDYLEKILPEINHFNHHLLSISGTQLYFAYGTETMEKDDTIPLSSLEQQIYNRNLTRYSAEDLNLLNTQIPEPTTKNPLYPEPFTNKSLPNMEFFGIFQASIDNRSQLLSNKTFTQALADANQLIDFFTKKAPNLIKFKDCKILTESDGKRNLQILHQSPFDLTLVGSLPDVLEYGIDLQKKFHNSVDLPLTLSARIKLVDQKYPQGLFFKTPFRPLFKNSILLMGFTTDALEEEMRTSFPWEALSNEIIGTKYKLIKDFTGTLSSSSSHLFISYLLSLCVYSQSQKINIARLAYYLALHKPLPNADDRTVELYKAISYEIFRWLRDEHDFQQLILALSILRLVNHTKEEPSE